MPKPRQLFKSKSKAKFDGDAPPSSTRIVRITENTSTLSHHSAHSHHKDFNKNANDGGGNHNEDQAKDNKVTPKQRQFFAQLYAVMYHEFIQLFIYTFYFCIFQLIAFHVGLRAQWTLLVFLSLLFISTYEDMQYFDVDELPEMVLVFKIWANNFPLFVVDYTLYVLQKGHFMSSKEPGDKLVGRPEQIVITLNFQTGYEIGDDFFLGLFYFLFYFSSMVMFRSLFSQLRFVFWMWRHLTDMIDDSDPIDDPQEIMNVEDVYQREGRNSLREPENY